MRCVIPGQNVKLFGKAVQSLAKIGSELYLEGELDTFALRTVNSSRSAFGCVTFDKSFFQSYTCGGGRGGGNDFDGDADPNSVQCKIAAKSCLSVFRSLATLEKTVDRCSIDLDVVASKLIFVMHCKHGITKTYNLGFQECESLQAIFSKDLSVNVITAQSKLLQDVVANFQTSQEEITMGVLATQLTFKNYVDDDPDPAKSLLTETSLDPDEFDHYCVGVEASLTFCLKELRAILSFLDAAQQGVTMHFESGGKPLVFCVDSDVTYSADFVLATLLETLVHPTATSTAPPAPSHVTEPDFAPPEAATVAMSSTTREASNALASQSQSTQNISTTLPRANNTPSVPDRLTTVRPQKRRVTQLAEGAGGHNSSLHGNTQGWPEDGFPKRVRRMPYDDSQSTTDLDLTATSSVVPPSTHQVHTTESTVAMANMDDLDIDPFGLPASEDLDDIPGSERDFGDSMVPPSSIDSAILATSSSRAMDTAIEKHNERRNLPPSSWIKSQERDRFNPMETPTSSVPQYSLSESSDITSTHLSGYNSSVVMGTMPTGVNRSDRGAGSMGKSTTTPSISQDLSMAVGGYDDDDEDENLMEESDAMVERTAFSATGVCGGLVSGLGLSVDPDNTIVSTVRSQSPNTRKYCNLFFGGIPDNFARGPTVAAGELDEEVLAEDTDDEG